MNTTPITPKAHLLIDYALVASLFTLPTLLRMDKKAKRIYTAEALVLLPYVAVTKQTATGKGLIPFQTHGKIDYFNIAQFALQSFLPPIRTSKKTLAFNISFTVLAGLTVLLTDWKSTK